ncbi:MAG: LacI family DNA-binding transcriptional regulator, partial [Chloroflexi bacterium]|nr:LacI family DNA-binding transcriptional regulator [Chloroflexota bacterium]
MGILGQDTRGRLDGAATQTELQHGRPSTGPVTIRDVAARAGVSSALVSFVLTGSRPVGKARRRRVLEAIDALGYTPNAAARGLRLQRSGLVALMIPYLNNPIYSLHATGAEQELARAGLLTVVCSTRGEPAGPYSGEAVFRALGGSRVDGVLLFPYQEDVPEIVKLTEDGVPVVLIDREPELPAGAPPVDAVVVDNEHGVYRATEHLLALGHRRIGLVSLSAQSLSGPPRLEGYRRAYRERRLDVPENCIALGHGSVEDGYALTERLLRLRSRPTALVVTATMCTPGALRAIHDATLRVPEDLSVVGYSHEGFLMWPTVDLTAIRYPAVELGREAARLLLRRLGAPRGAPRGAPSRRSNSRAASRPSSTAGY